MRKVDFEKIEKEIDEVMRNMSIKEWLELATISNLIGGISFQPAQDQKPVEQKRDTVIEKILASINKDLDDIQKNNEEFYNSFGMNATDRTKFLNPKNMNPEDWMKLKLLREKLNQYQQFQPPKKTDNPEVAKDEEHITKERLKHKNKRFNVREAWVPLDTKRES